MLNRLLAPSIALSLLISSAILAQRAPEAPAQRAAPEAAVELSKANNKFGVDLFKQLHEPGKNTFMSPLSISIALQMAAEGAEDETLEDMRKAMHLGNIDTRASNKTLLGELAGRKGVKLSIANSVWADPARVTMNDAFVATARDNYDSEARTISFSDPRTLDIINGWISDKTEGLITDMIDEIPPEAVAYLINAIYFKGDWSSQFDKADTKDDTFKLAESGTTPIRMMKRDDKMQYGEHNGAQIVKLPYGEDKQAAMWVILPAANDSLDNLIKNMDAESLNTWRKQVRERQGMLKLPRFKLSFKATLNDVLEQQGMDRAFSDTRAQFDPMGISHMGPLYINRVLHEAVVIVTEEGTEAAAATVVEMGARSAPPRPFTMTCDRPFLFFITDEPTGAVMFQGTVYHPENPQ